MKRLKRMIMSWVITPKRVRGWVAKLVSALMAYAMATGAWDAISSFSKWLRRLADFIDSWNATELPEEQDNLIVGIVEDAISDEAIDKLVDKVSAMKIETPKEVTEVTKND